MFQNDFKLTIISKYLKQTNSIDFLNRHFLKGFLPQNELAFLA
jgi:hypothetical protein